MKGKEKEHYRPISLINKDAKILKKKLASQIQQCINRMIHHDQMVFTPEIQRWLNTFKSVLYHFNKMRIKIL